MEKLEIILSDLKEESDKRYDKFKINEIGSIKRIYEDAKIDITTWLGGDDEFVCLFIDLNNSSQLSFRKNIATMAKLYDYFTQNVVDVMSIDGMRADYIDIKGDGAFGIYEGKDAEFKALCAAVTFKTFFEKNVRPKFGDEISCKAAIHKDKVLVRKIGKRGEGNNNEVWAGGLVNNAAKLSSLAIKILKDTNEMSLQRNNLLIISEKIHNKLLEKEEYAVLSCGHDSEGNEITASNLWREYDISNDEDVFGDKVWCNPAIWCKKCGDEYMANILS